jgi:IMP dehydrogenase
VPYKGELNESMLQFIGGLRWEWDTVVLKTFQLYRKRDVLFITASGINESHPHNVTITKESPITQDNKRIE